MPSGRLSTTRLLVVLHVLSSLISDTRGGGQATLIGTISRNNTGLVEDVSEATLSIVRSYILRFHQQNIYLLDVECFASYCPFARARQMIGNTKEATRYWNYINCVKYGATCPVAGGWTHWVRYSSCSSRCDAGYSLLWRNCTSPHPLFGGPPCKGTYQKLLPCKSNEGLACASDPSLPGIWSEWSTWSECKNATNESASVRERRRMCLPSLINEYCEAFGEQSFSCLNSQIDVDGGWSHWLQWSDCSVNHACGNGVRIRKRYCSNPYRLGEGYDCIGPSSQAMHCVGPKCSKKPQEISHLLQDSYLRYPAILPAHYLNMYLKFFPNANEGLLLQYSNQAALQDATKSGSVKVKKPTLHQLVNTQLKEDQNYEVNVKASVNPLVEESFILAMLDSPTDVRVQFSINGSSEISIPLAGVKQSKWNELSITAISDKIVCRLNDGENIEARIEEFVDKTKNNATAIESILGTVKNVITNLLGTRRRQVFSYFDGEIGLGNVRDGMPGFRGYISEFSVNYKAYTLKNTPRSQIRKRWDPVQVKGLSHSSGHLASISTFTHFSGRETAELLLMGSWVKASSLQSEFGATEGQITSFEFVIMPECKNGLFFYLESEKNPLTHWKLFVEDYRRIRFVMSYGGEITILTSRDDLQIFKWNKVVLQLVVRGLAHLKVNEYSYSTHLPNSKLEHLPKRYAHVGGFGKPIEHDLLLGTDPTEELREQFKSYIGYIYSVKVNNQLFVVENMRKMNNFHMLSSRFTLTTQLVFEVMFLPSSADLISKKSGDDLIPMDFKLGIYRSIICHIPKIKGVLHKPDIAWYFNGKMIKQSSSHWVTEHYSNVSHKSSLYFGSAVDSSASHSGIYYCVASYFGHSYVIATFPVAVLSDGIAHAGNGIWNILNVSSDTAILIISMLIVCILIVFLFLMGCVRKVCKKIIRKGPTSGSIRESASLIKANQATSSNKTDRSVRKKRSSTRAYCMNLETAANIAKYAGKCRRILLDTDLSISDDELHSPVNNLSDDTLEMTSLNKTSESFSGSFETTPLIK